MSTRYHIGTVMAGRIIESNTDDKRVAALALRNRRCGFDRPVTPATLADHFVEAQAWLEEEVEAGRDPSYEEIEAAGRAFGRTIVLADVPQSPSQS